MIPRLANLAWWEWFKLRRRWLPWILLAVLLLFTQGPPWGAFADYRQAVGGQVGVSFETRDGNRVDFTTTCADVRGGRVQLPEDTPQWDAQEVLSKCRAESIGEARSAFTLPYSVVFPMGMLSSLGLILLALLCASTIGTDYSWGTLRTVLATGAGRWQYLAAKLLLMALVVAGAMAVLSLATMANSLLASSLAPDAPPYVAAWMASQLGGWPEVLEVMGRALVSILVYLTLATFVTVWTRSLAAGIAISMGYTSRRSSRRLC